MSKIPHAIPEAIKDLDQLARSVDDPEEWMNESACAWPDIKAELLAGRALIQAIEKAKIRWAIPDLPEYVLQAVKKLKKAQEWAADEEE